MSAALHRRLFGLFGSRLYLRIWLAVVVAVALLALLAGWAWRAAEDARRDTTVAAAREMIVLNADGEVLGTGQMRPIRDGRRNPDAGQDFSLQLPGQPGYVLRMPPREHRPIGPPWARGPYATSGYLWLLAVVALAVGLGVYPLVRRLTSRLEGLHRGVTEWGTGNLRARVPVHGHDEVADLAQRFNSAADHIEALMDAQKSLLANASHELRSPLARIRLAIELMDHNPSPATRSEIKRNIAELDQLVDEILLASRLDARQVDLGTIESVDMLGLVAEEAAMTGAELQLDGEPERCQVNGVAKLLRRMVRNLLENAKRYGAVSPEAPVTVTLLTRGQTLTIQVADHGPGVPSALRERIFEPFFRTPGASETAGGVGLGLALVKSIAERHGGAVRCEARSDGATGAVFVLELPAGA
ncbi:two-component sensor histidine kinase [Comamonas serinivorans]|uniref:histidine kinase n=1 Tax=Comamonas serinivorans TaxID=1082851 RepID=A0A1Y0ETB3_9BURK|nr:HAMP domain-containing sensor histidine kinase [Comamonas serinivorans]ARU06472.1 two-component sensor histidine kinase [Comamonas serinivorans]